MIELQNISWTAPNGKEVLKNINLSIPSNKLVVITGPNGSGKTTLAKIIAGIQSASSGSIIFNGSDITNLSIDERAKLGISYAFQQPVRFKGITVEKMLKFALSSNPEYQNEIAKANLPCIYNKLLMQVGLCSNDYLHREINQNLSGGEIKRIEIATVLARNSLFSLFDEPEAGIDLWSFNGLIDAFQKLKSQNRSTIIISHQERILAIADEIIILDGGKVKTICSPSELSTHLSDSSHCPNCPKGQMEVN